MALPVIGDDAYYFVIRHSIPSADQAVCTGSVQAAGTMDLQDVADDIAQAWSDDDSIHHIQSSHVTYSDVTVYRLNGASAPVSSSDFANPTGQQTPFPAPPQCARIVTLRTGTIGRAHRGRMYIPGEPIDALETDGARWDSSTTGTVTDAFNQFRTLLDGNGLTLAVLSRLNSSQSPVTSISVRSYLGTQRRRVALI